MPYSFTQIEEDKSKTIQYVFSALILFYFVSFWSLALLVKNWFILSSSIESYAQSFQYLTWTDTLMVLGAALAIGYMHWSYTTASLVPKIIDILKAQPLNPDDTYHQRFQNIVDEVSVATGGTKMEAVIIPTSAMNAFAIADFSGKAVIGTTEGMLARLSRAQLEAVVGHEAAHIVTGDCLATTITTSMFALYSGILKGLELMLRGSGRRRTSIGGRGSGGGGVIVFLLLVYLFICITKLLSHLIRLFISRQREFRADAIAVRLTRDPLSLAEALYEIKYRWRGSGLPAQELEAIFTVNPSYSRLDESSGLLAQMFSTHPPMRDRLKILLDMAHADANSMIERLKNHERPRVDPPNVGEPSGQWLVHQDGQWQGPFTITRLMTLKWLKPENWVKRVGGDQVTMAYEDKDICKVVNRLSNDSANAWACPKCQTPLMPTTYEGAQVHKCAFCKGTLVHEHDVNRLIVRMEVGYSDHVKKIAEGIRQDDNQRKWKPIDRDPKSLLHCPVCLDENRRLLRMFYTEAYRVEVDKCFRCHHIWFDRDELEVLQYLIETATVSV